MSRLPPEGEWCGRRGGAGRASRKAVDLLVSEGLVRRVQGKRTFVASEMNGAPTVGDMEQLIHRVARASSRSKVVDVKIREVIGDPDICRDLEDRKSTRLNSSH